MGLGARGRALCRPQGLLAGPVNPGTLGESRAQDPGLTIRANSGNTGPRNRGVAVYWNKSLANGVAFGPPKDTVPWSIPAGFAPQYCPPVILFFLFM